MYNAFWFVPGPENLNALGTRLLEKLRDSFRINTNGASEVASVVE